MDGTTTTTATNPSTSGDKGRARDVIAAIRALQQIERERRPATPDERQALARFGGFGPLALHIFPDPVKGTYRDATWQAIGEELHGLLTQEEYDSAKQTTFSQYFTSPIVMEAMHDALARLGVPADATVLEPGCGIGNFMAHAKPSQRFVGIELDSISGRIARALHPQADIRIEGFQDSRIASVDAVIGNPPFGDVDIKYAGEKRPIHDFFFAKGVDILKPGGIMALITSRFTLDKLNASTREYLAERADFLGAIRLPSTAFKREGTDVVTDIIFFRKRAPGLEAEHADSEWLTTSQLGIDGLDVSINRYFQNHPEMVLGDWSRKDTLHAGGISLIANGDLASQLKEAIARLPKGQVVQSAAEKANPPPAITTPAFTPPPPLKHINESSFFVGDDRIIYQVIDGQGQPVIYGGTLLRSDGTMTGKRMGSEIEMVTLVRRVLQSQNEGWPEANRNNARRDLNRAYDRFVAAYGPINKTTFSETSDGSVIRRMPNVVKFREDPDAMLVLSLEDYDEVTGKATKAAIMQRDVVGRAPDVTSVATAEEGLLVSLDRKGCVDLPFIAGLYGKPEDAIIAELGELIYRDPDNQTWQTADAYLSGNVRAKLASAEAAGLTYARNAEALRQVQPEDVLPGDIDANLGAPWIPVADIRDFAATLFGVSPAAVEIGHLKKDAVWSVEAGHQAEQSVAATTDYGTPRANGVALLEQALNLKTPVIYDTVHGVNGEERIVNQEATLAAREKQKLIKERFKAWTFAAPDRTERLVRLYNDTYNNLRPRLFDGSHLDFPGMSRGITLNPHQQDAVWRGMSSGNTLLAHAVGAGKTFTMAATGMKMKQAGLIHKPLYVVPNHMLEQFAREFMQLYPNAKLLVAGKDDLARDRRKLLTAKIASGQWDGIVMTHSSFERIGMSRDYQARFLRGQIAEYEELLCDSARSNAAGGSRNIIKTIEKQKARRQERLKELLAQDKKDDGLVFEELGVDHIFIDESHYFKNLETPTKMERVAGIQTGGSERAFDLYMKARYLGERHPGHGVTFATGTPVSNTMVELYTVQKFLDPEGLAARGIEHFDAWAATFGEVVESMEISPDGASLRPRSRFARFVNLPELQQMFKSFADVQTAEMLDLPRPKLEGGKPITVACAMSDEQARIQKELVDRYDRLRKEKVDPREDNALAITTDGRKLALDARMLSPAAAHPGSKVNALADRAVAIWERSTPTRGTQLIFCDMGVHPTPRGYCVYDEIVGKLISRGIPRGQIAAIGDADTDAKKQALFDKVRSGAVRVLIGSTQKMGTGTNVQKRLVALHHLDAPWKPAEVEQREGRILRQGNSNAEVAIYRYVTEGSFDAYMWQALETKARFISQVMTGQSAVRRAEDIGGQELSYAEVKAIASGNPAVLTLAEADAEIGKLAVLKKNHADEQYLARRNVRDLPATIDRLQRRAQGLTADMATLTAHAHHAITIGARPCTRDDAIDLLSPRLKSLPEKVHEVRRVPLGTYRGLDFGIVLHPIGAPEAFLEGQVTRHAMLSRDAHGPRAIMNALDRLIDSYASQTDGARQDLAIALGQLRDYRARLGQPFTHEAYLAELTTARDQLRAALSDKPAEPGADPLPPAAELAARINALKSSHSIEASPPLAAARRLAAETPVTARLRKRIDLPAPEPAIPAAPAEPPLQATSAIPAAAAPAPDEESFVLTIPAAAARPRPDYRERVARQPRQLSLF